MVKMEMNMKVNENKKTMTKLNRNDQARFDCYSRKISCDGGEGGHCAAAASRTAKAL